VAQGAADRQVRNQKQEQYADGMKPEDEQPARR